MRGEIPLALFKMKNPDPKSNRSKRRQNRGFKSLELSSRKHRRAGNRLAISCSLSGKSLKPGEKAEVKCGLSTWVHTAGGSMQYH